MFALGGGYTVHTAFSHLPVWTITVLFSDPQMVEVRGRSGGRKVIDSGRVRQGHKESSYRRD